MFPSHDQEKELEYVEWTIEHKEQIHFIDNDFVIDVIKNSLSKEEKKQVWNILSQIDFKNGNVNHFLEHLANGYIKTNY